MNKWHLVKEKGTEGETLCGRTSLDGAFTSKTARQVTDQMDTFYRNPCTVCLKRLRQRDGKLYGTKYKLHKCEKHGKVLPCGICNWEKKHGTG